MSALRRRILTEIPIQSMAFGNSLWGIGGKNSHRVMGHAVANSDVRNADTYGGLNLPFTPGSYDCQFIPEESKSFTDSDSDLCR
jgi:hypothetical protein